MRVARTLLAALLRLLWAVGDPGRATGRALRHLPGWARRGHHRVGRLGLRWTLDLRDNVQRELFYRGTYEHPLRDLLLSEIRAGDTVVDVGAHIGIHALPVARHLQLAGGGSVVAFEAAGDTADALRRNAAANGLGGVEVVNVGLGRSEGTGELRADDRFGAHDAAVRSRHGPGAVVATFPITTFDAWARRRGLERLDVVKIDVEGDELDVLSGMRATLEAMRPRLLVVEERDYIVERAGGEVGRTASLLADLGYTVVDRVDANLVLRRHPHQRAE